MAAAVPLPALELALPVCDGDSDAAGRRLRVVVLSDTHNFHDAVDTPAGDILVHCGDFTTRGTAEEVRAFASWFGALPHPQKILVAGNHDQGSLTAVLTAANAAELLPGLRLVEPAGLVDVEGVTFFCAGWLQQRLGKVAEMPAHVDVLVTHGGPQGVFEGGDGTHLSDNWDGAALLQAMARAPPRVHLFGHTHEHGGSHQLGLTADHPAGEACAAALEGTLFVNCAQAAEGFAPVGLVRGPVVFDIAPLPPGLRKAAPAVPLPTPGGEAPVGASVMVAEGPHLGCRGLVVKVAGEGSATRWRVQLEGDGSAKWVNAVKVVDAVEKISD